MRPTTDEYFLQMARLVATRATCARRQVGCILVDEHRHVLATGYNGLSAGERHCIDTPCPYAGGVSGTPCDAIHAEINALIQCSEPHRIHTVYCTTSPCKHCIRALLNTPAWRIVFLEEYPHLESKHLWQSAYRKWDSSYVGR